MFITPGPVQPIRFQKAMIFVDGTNLFHRLEGVKLTLTAPLKSVLVPFVGGRQVVRCYLYTTKPELQAAIRFHGDHITKDIRVVFGEAVPTSGGNYKEKGVDALLVADLVYHAAVKNYDYALLVSTDTDFAQALRRVEDFGCRTGLLAVCAGIPDRLREACDEPMELADHALTERNEAKKR